jgi:S-adenosylmethionine decarboxylase
MFEGIEKKFEILLSRDHPSLRALGLPFWTRVVEEAGATLLSTVSNERCDAHLLSESSLFVYDRRAIMITCGRTSLARAVEALARGIDVTRVLSFIYERKNENFPHLQPTTFQDDVQVLSGIFAGCDLCFGDPESHHLSLFHLNRDFTPEESDTTVEVLMYGLDSRVKNIFTGHDNTSGDRDQARSEILALLPGFRTDDYFFDPHGYSMNAIRSEDYFTVHVTPEDPGSYASFETNIHLPVDEQVALVRRIIRLFRPERFDLARFQSTNGRLTDGLGYHLETDETRKLECGYRLRFSHFLRTDSTLSREPR